MALFRLFVDSSTGVDINPEYNFSQGGAKVEERHRVKDGGEFVYKWGEYERIKFGVEYVNSSFMCTVNSWWGANTELLFMEVGVSASVRSVHLINRTKPIDQNIKPYRDQFKGVIDLGTY